MNASRFIVAAVLVAVGAGFGCSGNPNKLDAAGHSKQMRKMVLDFVAKGKKATPTETASMGTDIRDSLKSHQKTSLGDYTATYAELAAKCEQVIEEGRRATGKTSPAVTKLLGEMEGLAKKLPE